MDVNELPAPLRHEVREVERCFGGRADLVVPGVLLTLSALVRGVPVALSVDLACYPAAPPTVGVAAGWYWIHEDASIRQDRQVEGLRSIDGWNRTLGLAAPLRELEQLFRERPPQRQLDSSRVFASLLRWLTRRVR